MSEIRRDILTGTYVLCAQERCSRPNQFKTTLEQVYTPPDDCPFCMGNEAATPQELFVIHNGPSGQWSTRVIANRQPLLEVSATGEYKGGLFHDSLSGLGAHEVIIETNDHHRPLADLETDQIRDLLSAYANRLADLTCDIRLKHILIFKNQGRLAGALQSHAHSQLLATSILPPQIKSELDGAQKYYARNQRCIFCDMITDDMRQNKRIIGENNEFIAIAPFASRFPYECWIMPKYHSGHFQNTGATELTSLAAILKSYLMRLGQVLKNPDYNLILHSAPVNLDPAQMNSINQSFHWHIEILPRTMSMAGFEWGTDCFINPFYPEKITSELNSIYIDTP